ncbi:MAG: hypothetical protein ABI670_08055 [Chloroflexota bacterium]
MGNWMSGIMSKFRRDDSDNEEVSAASDVEYDDPGDAPVSPLAMMNEKSPEAWLGQFLTILGAPPALQFSTITAAKRDERLLDHLRGVMAEAGKEQPLLLLEHGYADQMKAADWAAWWRASEALGRYAYAAMSLTMLGDESVGSELVQMYRQTANSRIQKDAQYVISYLLGKEWPSYSVTEADLERLSQ